eukprot:gene1247-1624_t
MVTYVDDKGNATKHEPFAEGFMTSAGFYLGRPVDVQQYVDGSILVSDDKAGAATVRPVLFGRGVFKQNGLLHKEEHPMGCLLKGGGGLYARLRIGAVLLAAGEGRRMGGVPKALITLQGVPLINRHLIALSGAGVDEVVVVTGFGRDAVEAQIATFPVTLAHNADFAQGQQGSVRVGLAALRGAFDAVLVVLADQPLIGAPDLTELIAAFKKKAIGNIV